MIPESLALPTVYFMFSIVILCWWYFITYKKFEIPVQNLSKLAQNQLTLEVPGGVRK